MSSSAQRLPGPAPARVFAAWAVSAFAGVPMGRVRSRLKTVLLLTIVFGHWIIGCRAADQPWLREPEPAAAATAQAPAGFFVLPSPAHAVQFRLCTNGAPDSIHLFNTFEIEAYGETLLASPGGSGLHRWLASSPSARLLHNILVNGAGPQLASSNSMTVIEQASGPDWHYVALDASAAYRDQLEQFKRGILFVAPDLFILYDHLVARRPSDFQMLLHPPVATRMDPVWGDLRLELPRAGLRIHAPAARRKPRPWERIESATDREFPDTVTLQLAPTNKLAQVDLVTVFAIHRRGEAKELAFRLLESPNAIGARIHRNGLPTLVAFKTDATSAKASLTGFEFSGPIGVDVFKPKQKTAATPRASTNSAPRHPVPGVP